MALDLRSQARNALVLAKSLGAQAFEPITLRINPTTAVNLAADTESTTWEHEIAVAQALQFDESSERVALPLEATLKNWLVDVQDLPTGLDVAKLDQNCEILDGDSILWEVYRSELDPTGSIALFYSRKSKVESP